jgi:hypothetical protein
MARHYLIDLNDRPMLLEKRSLRPFNDTSELAQDTAWLIQPESAVSQVLRIDAPAKYAESLIRRQLQEKGEMEESPYIITHWKRSRDKTTTELLYTAIPTSTYLRYQERQAANHHHLMIFSLYEVLWQTLRQLKRKEPVALVLLHDGNAELLVGSSTRPLTAATISAYTETPDTQELLWNSLAQELRSAEENEHIKLRELIFLHWLEDEEKLEEHAVELTERLDATALLLPSEPLDTEQGPRQASLPQTLKFLKPRHGLSTTMGLAAKTTQMSLPLSAVSGLILAAGLAIGGQMLHVSADNRTAEADHLQTELRQRALPPIEPAPDYQSTLDFAQELAWVRIAPSYRRLLSELSSVIREGQRIESMSAEYGESNISVSLRGTLKKGFREAQAAQQGLLLDLRQLGYRIVERNFTTDLDRSRFEIKMERPLQ